MSIVKVDSLAGETGTEVLLPVATATESDCTRAITVLRAGPATNVVVSMPVTRVESTLRVESPAITRMTDETCRLYRSWAST